MKTFLIREAAEGDLPLLLQLYTHLHHNPMPEISGDVQRVWRRIQRDPNHRVLLGFWGDIPVSSCVAFMVDNLTNNQRPYMLIENVVTHTEYRGRGYGTAVLNHARELARSLGCYKIMLMTGSKKDSTLRFYRQAGYNSQDKTAFIQWL